MVSRKLRHFIGRVSLKKPKIAVMNSVFWVVFVVGDVLVHDRPEPFDGVEIGGAGGQEMQGDAASSRRSHR
jgi:hypothetical protein